MPHTGGSLYAIGNQEIPCVKIGYTRGPVQKRRQTIQTSCPFPVEICGRLFVEYDVERLEKTLHAMLRMERLDGEWFELYIHQKSFVGLVLHAMERLSRAPDPRSLPRPAWREGQAALAALAGIVGRELRGWRELFELSPAVLARRAEVSVPALRAIEAGEIPDLLDSDLRAIARALGTSVGRIVGLY